MGSENGAKKVVRSASLADQGTAATKALGLAVASIFSLTYLLSGMYVCMYIHMYT